LKYIFAVRKEGAIAHPDNYREVEQWTENPNVPVPIAIGTIPGATRKYCLEWKNILRNSSAIFYTVSPLTDIILDILLTLRSD
jgi:hypothetical protein